MARTRATRLTTPGPVEDPAHDPALDTPRGKIAAQIRADNTPYVVKTYPYEPENVDPGQPVVVVFRTELSPHPKSPNLLQHSVAIQIYGAMTSGDIAEAELDNYLDAVMLSLQRIGTVEVRTAKRIAFVDSTFQGWEIECTWDSSNIYATTVRNEGNQP